MNTVDLARRKEAMHALNPFAPGAGRQPKELYFVKSVFRV